MKKLLILFLLSGISFAQVGYVKIDHPVYLFLERMQTSGVISDYNSFELPKSRKDIGKWLSECLIKINYLNNVDKKILKDFINEFALETKSSRKYQSFVDQINLSGLFNEKEKYLYYTIDDSTGTNFFVNFVGDFTNINRSDINSSSENVLSANTSLVNFGGIIRGTFYDKIGFELFASNGTFFGNRQLANLQGENKFSYKFNYGPQNNVGTDFFDQTAGFISYQNNWMKVKLGRDKNLIGFGVIKDILSDNSTYYDYISLSFNYKSFSYSFMHSRLLGEMIFHPDPLAGSIKDVGIKNFVYHRFGMQINKTTFIGVGETVIYNDRSIDLSYLNPFNFYKSAEHANQDRDNSMLFFDFSNYSIPDFKFYASLIIDDLDFSKFGTSWLGNITILNTGIYSTILKNYLPLDFEVQYLRIDPYAYTHRIKRNNYTNFGAPLGAPIQPNSSTILLKLLYTPYYRLWFDFMARYTVHGANETDASGNLINNGGDINWGYRKEDLPDAKFLSGKKTFTRFFAFHFYYQPIKNYFIRGGITLINMHSLGSRVKYIESKIGLSVQI